MFGPELWPKLRTIASLNSVHLYLKAAKAYPFFVFGSAVKEAKLLFFKELYAGSPIPVPPQKKKRGNLSPAAK